MVAAVLDRPMLVLNRNWQPVGVASVARTLVTVYDDWADWAALRPHDGEPCIETRRLRLRVPEVVTLTNDDRVPANAVTFSRRNVFKRDRFTCQDCDRRGRYFGGDGARTDADTPFGSQAGRMSRPRRQPGSEELTIDHVVPRTRGGVSSWTNCVLACVEYKADRTPEQAGMTLRQQPAKPLWQPLYASHRVRIDGWRKFLSNACWHVSVED